MVCLNNLGVDQSISSVKAGTLSIAIPLCALCPLCLTKTFSHREHRVLLRRPVLRRGSRRRRLPTDRQLFNQRNSK